MLDCDVHFVQKYVNNKLRFVGVADTFRVEIELSLNGSGLGIEGGNILKLLMIPTTSEELKNIIVYDCGWKSEIPKNSYEQKALKKIICYFSGKKYEQKSNQDHVDPGLKII